MRRLTWSSLRGSAGLAALAAFAVVLAGCTSTSSPASSPASSSASSTSAPGPPSTPPPSPSTRPGPRLDDWVLGSRVLPLREDGYGQVRPTPRELRVRVMPTTDVLSPPGDDRFHGTLSRITQAVRDRMGTSWKPGCPVGLRDLRYLTVTFHGFDGRPHTGELVVNAEHARGLVGVFRTLYAARFPIEQMTLPTSTEPDPTPSGDGNGAAAFVCRPTTGQTFWSAHASGMALDLNSFQNPYVRDDLVIPELASAYLDRSWVRPGMVLPGDVVVRAFARIGWSWGGDWQTLKDYQHFTATGR